MIGLRRCSHLVLISLLGVSLARCAEDTLAPEEPVAADPNQAVPVQPPEPPPPVLLNQENVSSSPQSTSGFNDRSGANANFNISTALVFFDYDQSSIKSSSKPVLEDLAAYLKTTGQSIRIEGHCDERGSVEYNLALGQRRAESVRDYLVNLGVSAESLTSVSFGEEMPRQQGFTESAHAQNRRVEFSR